MISLIFSSNLRSSFNGTQFSVQAVPPFSPLKNSPKTVSSLLPPPSLHKYSALTSNHESSLSIDFYPFLFSYRSSVPTFISLILNQLRPLSWFLI